MFLILKNIGWWWKAINNVIVHLVWQGNHSSKKNTNFKIRALLRFVLSPMFTFLVKIFPTWTCNNGKRVEKTKRSPWKTEIFLIFWSLLGPVDPSLHNKIFAPLKFFTPIFAIYPFTPLLQASTSENFRNFLFWYRWTRSKNIHGKIDRWLFII